MGTLSLGLIRGVRGTSNTSMQQVCLGPVQRPRCLTTFLFLLTSLSYSRSQRKMLDGEDSADCLAVLHKSGRNGARSMIDHGGGRGAGALIVCACVVYE